jgi:hypothetical protein
MRAGKSGLMQKRLDERVTWGKMRRDEASRVLRWKDEASMSDIL